ncbi:unnamed protein product, partial [Sphacelaria rigidula]
MSSTDASDLVDSDDCQRKAEASRSSRNISNKRTRSAVRKGLTKHATDTPAGKDGSGCGSRLVKWSFPHKTRKQRRHRTTAAAEQSASSWDGSDGNNSSIGSSGDSGNMKGHVNNKVPAPDSVAKAREGRRPLRSEPPASRASSPSPSRAGRRRKVGQLDSGKKRVLRSHVTHGAKNSGASDASNDDCGSGDSTYSEGIRRKHRKLLQ